MKKGAGVHSLNWGSLNRVSGKPTCVGFQPFLERKHETFQSKMYYIMLNIMTSFIQKRKALHRHLFLKVKKKVKVAYESLHWKKKHLCVIRPNPNCLWLIPTI